MGLICTLLSLVYKASYSSKEKKKLPKNILNLTIFTFFVSSLLVVVFHLF
jgi:hypothetical protein